MKKLLVITTLFFAFAAQVNAQSFLDDVDGWIRAGEKTMEQINKVTNYVLPKSIHLTNTDPLKTLYVVPSVSGADIIAVYVDNRKIDWNGAAICVNPGQHIEIQFVMYKDPAVATISYSFYTTNKEGVELETTRSLNFTFYRSDQSRAFDLYS